MNEHLEGLDQRELDEQELLEDVGEDAQKSLEEKPEESEEEKQERIHKERVAKNLGNYLSFSRPTKRHGNKSRGVGVTRKNKSSSKKARKQTQKSRKINRGK